MKQKNAHMLKLAQSATEPVITSSSFIHRPSFQQTITEGYTSTLSNSDNE